MSICSSSRRLPLAIHNGGRATAPMAGGGRDPHALACTQDRKDSISLDRAGVWCDTQWNNTTRASQSNFYDLISDNDANLLFPLHKKVPHWMQVLWHKHTSHPWRGPPWSYYSRIPITFSVVVLKRVEGDRPVLKVLFKGRLYISQQDTALQLWHFALAI